MHGFRKKATVNIVNRSYPPSPGVTGESAAELAQYFVSKDFLVNIIHVDAYYAGGAFDKDPIGNVFRIKTFYNGKNKLFRLVANLHEGLMLALKARSIPAEINICMTDPPLLNFWFALLFGSRRKWILWSMDLFPEAFVASDLISTRNVFFKYIDNVISRNPPAHIIALGPNQLIHLNKKFGKEIGSSILPCGVFRPVNEVVSDAGRPAWATDPSKIYFGYCGNLGEAHSVEFVLEVIKNMDPHKHVFILSVYGSKAEKLKKSLERKHNLQFVSSVKRNELRYIDVHLASLIEKWVNVCVPSKTVSSVCSGSAFLYCGPKNSDNWSLLKEAGWRIDGEDFAGQVRELISSLTIESIREKKAHAERISDSLNDAKEKAFATIFETISTISKQAKLCR